MSTLLDELKGRAQSLGFDSFGIARPDSRPDLAEKLRLALEAGWHADMDWMESTAERRASPLALWPEVRSVIKLGVSYAPETDPLALLGL